MKNQISNSTFPYFKIGFLISVLGTSLILLWIGAFKFTPTEANSIKPLVENSFLFPKIYTFLNVRQVSNGIGIIEISVAIVLLFSIYFKNLRKYAGIGIVITFLITLSFLFTTPGVLRLVDGFPIVDFFILKDLVFLGFGFMLIHFPKEFNL